MSIIDRCLDKNGILTVTLNRPDKLNALNKNILLDLGDICHEAVHQEQIKALLITGNGKAFCAGADISHLAECNAEIGYQFAVFGQTVFKQLSLLRKPVLMAVNGFAFGGGCEMAIAGHLRIAATTAKFGQPEVKLGVIPGYGGTQRLSRLIGKGRAIDLCITGRFIDGKTAYEWGLVTLFTPPETLLTQSREHLLMALQQGPFAVAAAIQAIDEGFDLPLPQALALEALHFASTCATKDKAEGTQAF